MSRKLSRNPAALTNRQIDLRILRTEFSGRSTGCPGWTPAAVVRYYAVA
jgi:hypothetical protein